MEFSIVVDDISKIPTDVIIEMNDSKHLEGFK